MQGPRAKRVRLNSNISALEPLDQRIGEDRTTSAGFETAPIDTVPIHRNLLIVVERRDFVRGCVTCWLDSACNEFGILATADAETSLERGVPANAAAALVGVDSPECADGWLMHQVGWLRSKSPNLPVVLIVEADDTNAAEALLGQLNVQGYIPTSSSVNVAAAALRLVIAGGHYFPAARDQDRKLALASASPIGMLVGNAAGAKLTPREEAVLSVLARGAQNKIIAYRLGMSISTVKAHVHSIIRKLKVRNRTEAVVAARNMQVQASRLNGSLLHTVSSEVVSISSPAIEDVHRLVLLDETSHPS